MTLFLQFSTLGGFGIFAALIAVWWFLLPQYHSLPAIGTAIAGIAWRVPDAAWGRLIRGALNIAPRIFASLRPSTSPVASPATQEHVMSLDLSSIVANLKADAESAAKAAGEAALKAGLAALPAQAQPFANALVTVAENPSIVTAISQLESLAPAILSLIAEAEQAGVQKAIAAGAVTQVAL